MRVLHVTNDFQDNGTGTDHGAGGMLMLLGEPFDAVITVCDQAAEACPVFPGARRTLHWSLDDPSTVTGSDEDRLAAFERTRREVEARLGPFIDEALRAAAVARDVAVATTADAPDARAGATG